MNARLALAAMLAALFGLAAACSDDEPGVTPSPGSDAPIGEEEPDGSTSPPYNGPAQGGLLPGNDAEPSFDPIDGGNGTVEASVECCATTFTLADDTGDETTARLVGDFSPLDEGGLALTYADGAWTATACIPSGEHVRYRFFFGQVREDVDNDAGALIDDNRHDPTRPTEPDGNGGFVNTITWPAGCGL